MRVILALAISVASIVSASAQPSQQQFTIYGPNGTTTTVTPMGRDYVITQSPPLQPPSMDTHNKIMEIIQSYPQEIRRVPIPGAEPLK